MYRERFHRQDSDLLDNYICRYTQTYGYQFWKIYLIKNEFYKKIMWRTVLHFTFKRPFCWGSLKWSILWPKDHTALRKIQQSTLIKFHHIRKSFHAIISIVVKIQTFSLCKIHWNEYKHVWYWFNGSWDSSGFWKKDLIKFQFFCTKIPKK